MKSVVNSFSARLVLLLALVAPSVRAWAQEPKAPTQVAWARTAEAQPPTQAPAAKPATTNEHAAADRILNHPPLVPGPEDGVIARLTANILMNQHFLARKKPFNEEFAGKFLDQYLDMLDPQHLLLLQSDVAGWEHYRSALRQMTQREGDTSPAEEIFNRYMQRVDQQVALVNAFLKTNRFVFDSNERYSLNRRTAPRPKDMAEALRTWGDRVRFEYLQEKLNDQKPEEIVKTITRRYARTQRFLKEYDHADVLQLYLTALAQVYDPHSDYMGKAFMDNFNIGMRLSLTGIGALLRSEDGYCIIQELTPGGPAELSGKFKPNDKIIAVAQGDQEPVDVVDMKLTKVVDLIRGPKGTVVRLTIIPANAADPSVRKTITLVRDEIKLEEREAKARIIDLDGPPKRRLGVIDLPSFYAELPSATRTNDLKSTTVDVARLLKKLEREKVNGIILDLRRNGGGSLEEAIRLTGLFIKEGPIVQVKDSFDRVYVDKDPDPTVLYNGPLLVLTSRMSASASEILAGALQDYGRALIVGDKSTHGKGTVQQLLTLDPLMRQFGIRLKEDPGALKFTIRKFYLPKGSSTQLKGVVPDIVLPSLNNFADMGESSLPNALSWDTIPVAAGFEPLNRVQPYLAELRKRSEERVVKDPDYHYVAEEIDRNKRAVEEKWVSMNETVRRQEKAVADAELKAYKLALRTRPDSGETDYELKLSQVDLPGLPPALPKTNQFKLARGTPRGGSLPDSAHALLSAGIETVAPERATGQTSTTPAGGKTAGGVTNTVATSGDKPAKAEEDDTQLPDAAMLEAQRILADYIGLLADKTNRDGVLSLAE